jgi:hypothetical protein
MVRLMSSLLGKCGLPAAAVAETRDTFETLLKQARRVFLMQEEDDFADRVSRFIVSRISIAVDEAKMATMGAGGGGGANNNNNSSSSSSSWEKTTTSKDASTSLTWNADQGLADMLSKREIHKTAAKRFSAMARSACASLTTTAANNNGAANGSMHQSNGSATRETEIDKSDIFLAILGEDGKYTIDQQKAKLDGLKAQAVPNNEGENSERLDALRTSSEELQSEREMIAQRIAELKISIEKLETYDAELCAKVVDLETELEKECVTDSAETSRLKEEVQEASNAVKYGTSVGNLVDMLKAYDDSLDTAVNGTVEASAAAVGDSREVASNKMEMLVVRVKSYFKAEAQCVEFLRQRIVVSQKEVVDLVSG